MVKYLDKIQKEFKGKTILITGGTGSVGLGLAKQLIGCNPFAIRILSNDENSIFEAKRNLPKNNVFTYMVGDIRDKDRLKLAIRDVDIVFHAAAMKHVDICEQNPIDVVKTNVIGTSNIIESSLLENISKFIFISTDKATNPMSTLGASKLLAERLTLDASSYKGTAKTVFGIVRFGNVMGSRGSVFQIFLNQIRNKKSLTVTDIHMTRFIMSISQAAAMILKVTTITKDKETYVLKMPSIKIKDLAQGMIDVCEKKFGKNNSLINFSKAREGERLHEFLVSYNELAYCHDIGDMYKISEKKNSKPLSINKFSSETTPKLSKKELHIIIKELLDEYSTL